MNGRLLLAAAGAAGLVLVLICLSRSLPRPGRPTHPRHAAHAYSGSHSAAPPATGRTSQPHLTAADADRLLPFPPDQIADAAQLAGQFTAAYGTYRYDEPPTEYVRRLEPMISPQLRPAIERAATDPATLDQRRRTQEISAGQAHPEGIRALGPSSITFLVAATEHIATAHATRQDTTHYAVTLIRTSDSWRVYAIDLAATGDSGDSGSTDGGNSP